MPVSLTARSKEKIFTKKKEPKKKFYLVMDHISDTLKQRIIDSADIVDTVGAFVELRRKGVNYTGLCPFHDDQHAGNLIVSPSKNIATCFACGDGAMDSVEFLKRQGMTFIEALKWIATRNGIPVNGNASTAGMPKIKVRPKAEPLYLDIKKAQARTGHYEINPFAQWLKRLPWYSTLQKASVEYWLKEYYVGTSLGVETKGWVIWWQVDALGRVLTGKVMKYKEDGHRDREASYSIDYIHSLLQRAGQLSLIDKSIQSCLFGLHLVFKYDFKTVCLVESEKSALVAQIFNLDTERIFLATGGKGKLTKGMIQPLVQKGCDIVLYPDIDAMQEWTEFARDCDYKHIGVTENINRLYDETKDSPKADIADILIRIMEERRDELFIRDYKEE